MPETQGRSLGQEDALQKGTATHSSILPGKSMGGGAWWATVHGVTKNWTRLNDWACTPHLEKTHTQQQRPSRAKKKNKGEAVVCCSVAGEILISIKAFSVTYISDHLAEYSPHILLILLVTCNFTCHILLVNHFFTQEIFTKHSITNKSHKHIQDYLYTHKTSVNS